MSTKNILIPSLFDDVADGWEKQVEEKRRAIQIVRQMLASGELDISRLSLPSVSPNDNGHKNTDVVQMEAQLPRTESKMASLIGIIKSTRGTTFTVKTLADIAARSGLHSLIEEKNYLTNTLWKMRRDNLLEGLELFKSGSGRLPAVYRYTGK